MKQKKYDTSIIDAEHNKQRKQELRKAFLWAIYPLGCFIFITAFIVLMAFAIVMMLSEPSLNGSY